MPFYEQLSTQDLMRETERMIDEISPMFHLVDPRITGAVLADLLGCLLAAYNPELREKVLDGIIQTTRHLCNNTVERMIKEGRVPSDWLGQTRQ